MVYTFNKEFYKNDIIMAHILSLIYVCNNFIIISNNSF